MPPRRRRSVVQGSTRAGQAQPTFQSPTTPSNKTRRTKRRVKAKKDDSLAQIAETNKVPFNDLAAANRGVTRTSAGMRINLPSQGGRSLRRGGFGQGSLEVPGLSTVERFVQGPTGTPPNPLSIGRVGAGRTPQFQGAVASLTGDLSQPELPSIRSPGPGRFNQQRATFQNAAELSSGAFIGPSPDVAQEQVARELLDQSRFNRATVSIETTGEFPDNIAIWWAEQWGLSDEDLIAGGYTKLGHNLWVRDSGPTSSGGGSGGGRGRGRGRGRTTTTTRVPGAGISAADTALNWRIATG